MWLLPYDRVTLTTPLTCQQIVARLERLVEPRAVRIWGFPLATSESAPFEGDVWQDGFHINRLNNYGRYNLPIIRGHLRRVEGQTKITMTFALHPLMIAYFPVWAAVAMIAALYASNTSGSLAPVLLVTAFVLLGYIIVLLDFKLKKHANLILLQKSLFEPDDVLVRSKEHLKPKQHVTKKSPTNGLHHDGDQLTRRGEKPKRRRWW